MEWYYVENNQQKGPVEESALITMLESGALNRSMLVWREGMKEWQPFSEVFPAQPVAGMESSFPSISLSGEATAQGACSQCGILFPHDQMVKYSGVWVCAECKPLFFQRIQQGVSVSGHYEYAGFGIRFAAKFLDGLIQQGFSLAVNFVFGLAAMEGKEVFGPAYFLLLILTYGFNIAYTAFFLGRFGATPGKMACGLRVIRPNGERLTHMRAVGRYFAEIVSSMILLIGYIMAAFDDEKRALHDRICDTRVVRK